MLNFAPSLDLKNKYKYNWDSTSIRYVGMKLAKDISELHSENYEHIDSKMKEYSK